MQIRGIDVSEHDGNIDWQQVREAGIRFAIVRAGFGSSIANRDKQFERNMAGALEADVSVGAYWFSYAYTVDMARNEAHVFMELMEPYRGKTLYPLCFDWEYDSDRYAKEQGITPSDELITDMAIAFLEELEAGGWYAMYYSNLDYYRNKFQTERLWAYDLWLADYSGTPDISCGIQQTGDSGQVGGIDARVDTDFAFKDYPSLIKNAGLNGYPLPERVPDGDDTGDNNEEASDVIYNHIDQVPEWARPTIQKLVDKGYLKGDENGNLALNDTMLRLLVINDRAGLYN